ncbi:hypothetical protein F5X96DRAFT_590612 [Biscogniauxia mediterranea]|nr:hypothetical protein F5X96DRAFT_590612 [Biscogniauxia mediterranea]
MLNSAIIYPLLIVVLVAVAIYVQVTSSTLTLPISTGTTVLTIILPFIAAANIFFTPALARMLSRRGAPDIQQLVPYALQIIQGVVTIIIATQSFEGFVPGQNLTCNLTGNWQRLWSERNGRAIERIQDAFNCCGLNSVKDRGWPPNSCEALYNRHVSCAAPWRASMQRTSGLEFGVAIAIGLMQLVHLALSRLRSASDGGVGGVRGYRRLPQIFSSNPSDRLIEHGDVEADEDEPEQNGNQNGSNRSYGAIDDGRPPRVEPSGLGEDANQWRS